MLFQTTSINGAGKSRRNERAGRKTSSDRGEIYFKSESNASVSSFSVILIMLNWDYYKNLKLGPLAGEDWVSSKHIKGGGRRRLKSNWGLWGESLHFSEFKKP